MIIAIRFGYGKSLSEVAQPETSPLEALDCLLAAAKSLLISWRMPFSASISWRSALLSIRLVRARRGLPPAYSIRSSSWPVSWPASGPVSWTIRTV